MSKKILKNKEFDHFFKIASEWWEPEGKFKMLHKILPIRLGYILRNIDKKNIKKISILDLGCGGGLTCEPLARLGYEVSGLDFIKENIEVAKQHAKYSKLKINYIYDDIDTINLKKKYDIILILEVLEHLDDWQSVIKKIKINLKHNGKLIISTINKTHLSKIFGIYVAENILKWVPKNTHDFNKLIKPNDLKKVLIENKFIIKNISGMNFNPIAGEWHLNESILPINYFCTAQLI